MQKKSGSTFARALALTLTAVVCFAGTSAVADEAGTQTGTQTDAAAAGITVAIDPETGELRPPTAEEAAALVAAMRSLFAAGDAVQPTPVTDRNGVTSVRLSLEHMSFSVAHDGDDGELHYGCLDDHQDAARLVDAQTAQPRKE